MDANEIKITVAGEEHLKYIDTILKTIETSSKSRGTGIAKRSPEYVKEKMLQGKAIIALYEDEFAGFCCESMGKQTICCQLGVNCQPKVRGLGLAKRIKNFLLIFLESVIRMLNCTV